MVLTKRVISAQSSRVLVGTLHYISSYNIYLIDFMTEVYRNL